MADTAWSRKQINKIINDSTANYNKESTYQKDSSSTVTSENVDNVIGVTIKINITNEVKIIVADEEINSKNYSKKI